MDKNYSVMYYQNEVGVREYNGGYTLEDCKKRIADHYRSSSTMVENMTMDEFKNEFLIKDRYRVKNK